jgi:hypothetical protein
MTFIPAPAPLNRPRRFLLLATHKAPRPPAILRVIPQEWGFLGIFYPAPQAEAYTSTVLLTSPD